MPWKNIDGYKWPYRISEDGVVQKLWKGEWVTLNPYFKGKMARVVVKMRSADDKRIEVPVVWLMADAFMGGRRPGYVIVHKDGQKTNNALWNLKFATHKECGKLSRYARRRAVVKLDENGEVVEIYRSATEAAEKNYMSRANICLKCARKIKDPRNTDGYDYRYEDEYMRKKPGRKKAGEMEGET